MSKMKTLTINGKTFTVVSPTPIASITLRSNAWVGNSSPYYQVVPLVGITENSQINLTPTVDQIAIFYEKDITFVTENAGGILTVYVFGQKPTNDYTIPADIVEVEHDGPKIYGIPIATPINPNKLNPAVTDEQIAEAVNDALAQVKESGEFDGKDGKDGNSIKSAVLNADYTLTLTFDDGTSYTTPSIRGADGSPGKDGTSVTVESVSESTEDGGSNVVNFSDGNTLTVKNGRQGDPGKDAPSESILYVEQNLTDEEKAQARANVGATSMDEVKEMLGIEDGFSVTGELAELDLDLEAGTELNVVSKIHRDSTWGESNKLVLHQVSGVNFVDMSDYLGGVGKVTEANGLTATINADSTVTVKGTSTASEWTKIPSVTNWNSTKIYPAGTYTIPQGFTINIRAAQYPERVTIDGLTGNLTGKKTIPQPFRITSIYYSVAAGATVDVTVPLGLFRSASVPAVDREYIGNVYTVDFGHDVYDGEYNWATGELKDVEGNTVGYYKAQEIKSLPNVNYLWTGFGEVTVSNVSSTELGKIGIALNEPAPAETIPSICDFTFTPTTMQAAYSLYNSNFRGGGKFSGREVPLLTTKGTLAVKDCNGDIKFSKYIDPIINYRNISDLLTEKGICKAWSKKFYLNADPILTVENDYESTSNVTWTWEFTKEDFVNTGIPAKMGDIPMASPCFYNAENSKSALNSRVYYNQPFPSVFSYNAETGKYTLVVRGVYNNIKALLTTYSKAYFYYPVETPYDISDGFAMGISAGDFVTFTEDYSDTQEFVDAGIYLEGKAGTTISQYNIMPTVSVVVPRNTHDAMDGMENAARMLNRGSSATSGDATVQGYSWIGDGDGVTDYTVQIQQKLDELHKVSNGGTINLGSGTYPISTSLIVYDNTRIIGNGLTVIEQTADNTHAMILSGSNITIKDLTVKLSGACTVLTACMYTNSENHPNRPDKYDNDYPENMYVHNLAVENVRLTGAYSFDRVDGYDVVSDDYENYKGVGIGSSQKLFFNYAHIDNVHAKNLMASVYGGGGSNYFNVTSEFCKYGLYINSSSNNTYFVNGHSYHSVDETGNHISMSDAIVYAEDDTSSTYHLRTYDTQGYKNLVFLGAKTESNKIDIQTSLSVMSGLQSTHAWGILKWLIVDYGRGNTYNDNYKHTPFCIGNATTTISQQQQFELSNPVIQNALSGAGIWGNISANTEFLSNGITLRGVCRYPSEKTVKSNLLPYILSAAQPTEDNPIEIIIDYSNRPIIGIPNYFIQFDHRYVASDYVISFDTKNTGDFDYVIRRVVGNTNLTEYFDYPQIGGQYTTYRMKISFTKALQTAGLAQGSDAEVFDYNPDGLIGICNIGMTVNDYAGRSFLGECGGSLYGNVDMHQNTLKNLPAPVDDGDAVSKAYLEERLAALEALISGM